MAASLSRPLLCLFDRNFDLSGALQVSRFPPFPQIMSCIILGLDA